MPRNNGKPGRGMEFIPQIGIELSPEISGVAHLKATFNVMNIDSTLGATGLKS